MIPPVQCLHGSADARPGREPPSDGAHGARANGSAVQCPPCPRRTRHTRHTRMWAIGPATGQKASQSSFCPAANGVRGCTAAGALVLPGTAGGTCTETRVGVFDINGPALGGQVGCRTLAFKGCKVASGGQEGGALPRMGRSEAPSLNTLTA